MQDTIEGNARLTRDNFGTFRNIKHINGNLVVAAKSKGLYSLPHLLSVKGITILSDCGLVLPNCDSIDGDITVGRRGSLRVEGKSERVNKIEVQDRGTLSLEKTLRVGFLTSHGQNFVYLPNLLQIDNNLTASKGTLLLQSCKYVGNEVLALNGGTIELPECLMVGKYVGAAHESVVKLPKCTVAETLNTLNGGRIEVPLLKAESVKIVPGTGTIEFEPPPPKIVAAIPKIDYQAIQGIFNNTAIAMF